MNLYDQLLHELQSFKDAFIIQTIEHAIEYVNLIEPFYKMTKVELFAKYGKTVTYCRRKRHIEQYGHTDFTPPAKDITKVIVKESILNQYYDSKTIWKDGGYKYIARQETKANKQFEDRLLKLCSRITSPSIEILSVSSTFLDPNLNIRIVAQDRFGKHEIHARTIIASGPVQRPHYRYIVSKKRPINFWDIVNEIN